MFRPQIQKTSTLFFIALFNLVLVFLAVKSETKVKKIGYEDKIIAVELMEQLIFELNKNFIIEKSKLDLYNSGLIGLQNSPITTIQDNDSLMFKSKLLTTHPNFAALIVEFFYDAEISSGDTIAVSMTGSFPGANLALLSVCETMNITPIIMSSAGSSAWGANRVDLSWPIIESYLFDNNFLRNRSIVYSMGGDNDNGDNLSDKGIEILESSIPNNVNFINEFSLIDNISKKINFFDSNSNNYSMYVNIGGGASSLGNGLDKDSLQVGLINFLDIQDIGFSEFKKSISYNFLTEKSIPMLNIKNIIKLVPQDYVSDIMTGDMKVGKGSLFYKYDPYNPFVISLCLLLSIALIVAIGIYSHIQIKKRMETHEVDSVV
ncbi:MAG: hypothetical protein CMG61_02855 [Candidatus Marinimicrobia bacterium]|nr:hypothetical protein [Candidatus Neomarinimicrobiota bacterium]|tara:strand:- start:16023 stop:17150 length:1128 start_codon:yes stop_codon:yes gene_type:complete